MKWLLLTVLISITSIAKGQTFEFENVYIMTDSGSTSTEKSVFALDSIIRVCGRIEINHQEQSFKFFYDNHKMPDEAYVVLNTYVDNIGLTLYKVTNLIDVLVINYDPYILNVGRMINGKYYIYIYVFK